MDKKVINYLLDCAGKNKVKVALDNPFRRIAFDGDQSRLGWVSPPIWEELRASLKRIEKLIEGKEEFIFLGMGGSINGIKVLNSLSPQFPLYFLDSLDPSALETVLDKIKKLEKVMVIPISKSGSTLETQLLATTLKELFPGKCKSHFLWLSDKESFSKLDNLGWNSYPKVTIQVNENSDIGGRFSCPHTLIFLLPLFLLLDRDIKKIQKLFFQYLSLREKVLKEAYEVAHSYQSIESGFFSIIDKEVPLPGFTIWATQLFQESLGSKKDNFFVKTAVGRSIEGFCPIKFSLSCQDKFLYLMTLMYYLEMFVAFFAYFKEINFVNQPYVERYKQMMPQLKQEDTFFSPTSLEMIVKEAKNKLDSQIKFIEVVLYFYPSLSFIEKLESILKENFPRYPSFVFLGSDWNHHSYQAAYLDKKTLYLILTLNSYKITDLPIKEELLQRNVNTLRLISAATYNTLKAKKLRFSVPNF
ncbi:MAG: hypothetical protein J7K71_04450 [Candidatus Omnitrophica bacterium]|nr:hypothetical protein [Candidatus Omnitrophota bacterium]